MYENGTNEMWAEFYGNNSTSMKIMESYNFCDDDETFYHDVKDIERYLKTADLEFIF